MAFRSKRTLAPIAAVFLMLCPDAVTQNEMMSLIPERMIEPLPVPNLVVFYTGSGEGYVGPCG